MSSSSHEQPKSQTDSISDTELDDIMPINKVTSFHGRLNHFINPTASPKTPHHNQPPPSDKTRMSDNTSNIFDPRSPKQPQLPITSPIPSPTQRIVTRSHTSSLQLPRTPPRPLALPLAQTPSRSPGPIRRAKRRPTTPSDSPPASSSLLRDTIPPNLILLLVGVNPGLQTGSTGYAYAHPTNLFWRFLHSSGITSLRHQPRDTYDLPDLYSVGNTNIVVRPTRDAQMLSKAEMDEGVSILEQKIAAQRPEAVCLVGKSIWEAVFRVRYGRAMKKDEFQYGWQDPSENMGRLPGVEWKGARIFVATTTSGLAAGMSLKEKEGIWAELGAWVVQCRAERGIGGIQVGVDSGAGAGA
ncbi:hypothetical protein N7478_008123 [Penicillium angulare]|uniref:uncharacterized protein n=1 Tax=Penicillium angulare TaxID=116970 RepID=UPI00254161F5|nr:uncharacterized protein N7478_008123 [Penicillium angulare]KAJ5272998.1 hypothetical protein N7478_008123 [Penicillium angulare]